MSHHRKPPSVPELVATVQAETGLTPDSLFEVARQLEEPTMKQPYVPPAIIAMTLDALIEKVRQLEADGVVLSGKMKDGSPSIEAKISWVVGQLGLSNNVTTPEGMAALEETVRQTVYKSVEDELCDLRAARLTEIEQDELRAFVIDFAAQGEIRAIGGIRAVLSDETLRKLGFVIDEPPSPQLALHRDLAKPAKVKAKGEWRRCLQTIDGVSVVESMAALGAISKDDLQPGARRHVRSQEWDYVYELVEPCP